MAIACRSLITSLRSSTVTRPGISQVRAFHATGVSCAPAKHVPPESPGNITDPAEDPAQGGDGFLGALFYGSKQAKEEGLVDTPSGQHSKIVGRGKYVHEKITHTVLPSRGPEYAAAAEAYFSALKERSAELGGVKLTGSWETTIGSVGDFHHILEYEGYRGLDETSRALRSDPEMRKLLAALLPHITSREHQVVSEFSFWPSSPPRDSGYPGGGVFEMRSYRLQPGKLLEWESAWRRGLEARRRFVQPVGAFFSQVGQLHEVHHIWQYPDMETRKSTREQAWSVGTWSETVQEASFISSLR
ncbi:nipsnap family protein [Tremella mesenterica]|uniref:Nipsnap family protein n=1 Tax=Tremella mesenterica TaxID=5217 RepID=A0A4Q1BRX6_TREME|nr:nipsnap family protein [Tremella mesenterica]